MEWGNLLALWLLPVIGLVLGLKFFGYRSKGRLMALLEFKKNQAILIRKKQFIRMILWAVGVVCLFVALLSPQWGVKNQKSMQKSRDVIVALDVSRSMLATDVVPNRLDVAKQKIKKLIRLLHGDRVSLVLFSGDAFVMCPLTRDKDVFETFLDDVNVETISSGTTNLAKAVDVVCGQVERASDATTKLMVVFTDGEDFSKGVTAAGAKAKKMNLKIYTVGVATEEGAPIPDIDNEGNQLGHIKNKQGTVVISKLNSELLKQVSSASGGLYLGIAKNDSDVQQVAKAVDQFERKQVDDHSANGLHERYYYFVAVAFVCFLLEWII